MYNTRKVRLTIFLILATRAITVAARDIRAVRQQEQAKRMQLSEDAKLDVEAITKAARVVHDQIDNGEIRSLSALQAAVQNEVEFQKIVIREQ